VRANRSTDAPAVARVSEPLLTDDITAAGLDTEVRRDLRGLQRDTAESVARHLVAAGTLVDEDPQLALQHARFARTRASRIAVVREAAGIAAYHAGEWAEALGELRAARRMGGGPGHLAVMADIERALGRPERALELSRGPEVRSLERADGIELAIVAAGARRDLGELDAAVVSLQLPELDPARRDPWSARLFYAYADNLLAAGREADALQWFVHAADADEDGETDVHRRIAELTGEPLPDDDIAFGIEDAAPEDAAPEAPEVLDAADTVGPPGDDDAAGTDVPEDDRQGAGTEESGGAGDGESQGARADSSDTADTDTDTAETAGGAEAAGVADLDDADLDDADGDAGSTETDGSNAGSADADGVQAGSAEAGSAEAGSAEAGSADEALPAAGSGSGAAGPEQEPTGDGAGDVTAPRGESDTPGDDGARDGAEERDR
jgi:tetratricopeptide (TPR) repeat protein